MDIVLDTIYAPGRGGVESTPMRSVGSITKVDGTGGAVLVKFSGDAEGVFGSAYLYVVVDGMVVPLRIGEATMRGERSATVTLVSVGGVSEAEMLVGCEVVAPVRGGEGAEEVEFVEPLVGYTVISVDAGEVGVIEEIDDSVAANPLFVVQRVDGRDVLLPATDDFVVAIDDEAQTITMRLPEGLLDIESAEEV